MEMYAYSCLCVVAYNQGPACGPAILWRVYTQFWLARYNTHKMLFESLILGITNKNLRSNKSSQRFIVLLINHRPVYQQRMKSCMNLNFVYLCCINILICVLYPLACYIYLYMILCPFYIWSYAYFLKKKRKRKKKQWKKQTKKSMEKKGGGTRPAVERRPKKIFFKRFNFIHARISSTHFLVEKYCY